MNRKKIRLMILNLEKVYNLNKIEKIAEKNLFTKRKGKISAKSFLNMCTFLGEDLCSASLVTLCAKLESNEHISISPQALSKRFNEEAVNFIKNIFCEILNMQNEVLRSNGPLLKNSFNRILIADSTNFKLDDKHAKHYKGTREKSALKIQLQYDLLTGEFILCEIKEGSSADASYLGTVQDTLKEGDLALKDLGYFKTKDLDFIDKMGAFYISKIKVNTNIYKREEIIEYGFKGKVTKRERYSPINIKELLEPLAEGETIELNDVYIGNTKKNRPKSRLILTKLTEECKRKKELHNKNAKDKGSIKALEENKWWLGLNCYITNVPKEILDKEAVHDIYSLRWQIEIMFKIWKSLFKIHEVKKAGLERIQCFIYGRLIMLLLSSSIVFTTREITYKATGKELSEIKSFGIVKQYFNELYRNIFKGSIILYGILKRIALSIQRYGIKSIKKDKITAISILQNLKMPKSQLSKMVV